MIGSTISHYNILEKLGEGGMGVVYKALDTKLNRLVALKFLPRHVSASAEDKARFMLEAQSAAALNHPNICTIHGIEEHEVEQFIVMEYVDGKTFRDLLGDKSMTIDNATSHAIAIGDALQEAHSKGIVHRDIKADNVMLNSKSQVKVMDFGLAKLKGSLKVTRTSSTVGTLAYMAPEQIQGGEVDARSDIFAFGVLLYEMLAGRLPFRGEHEAAMMYSIMNEEPQNILQFLPDISPEITHILAKAMEKDPADRYQNINDLVVDIRRAKKHSSRVSRTFEVPPTGTVQRPSSGTIPVATAEEFPNPRKKFNLYMLISAGALAVSIVAGYLILMPGSVRVNPAMNTKVLQVPFTQYSYPSLSPDGKWIAFPAADASGKWDIYYMHINGGEPRKISSDGMGFNQQSASISPDGSLIVYDKLNQTKTSNDLYTISALGGASRKLVDQGVAGQWAPDGERVGFIRTPNDATARSNSKFMEFWTVKNDGSGLRREFVDSVFVTAGGDYRFSFSWSPDSKSIVWIRSQSGASQSLVLHDLSNGTEVDLTRGGENIDMTAWTVENKIVFSSNRGGNTNLWAVATSGGEPVQVTKGGGPDIGLSTAASGNELVYLQQQPVGFLWTANIDGSALHQISFDDREIIDPRFSPDKKRIAFVLTDPDPLTKRSDLYVMDRDGNNRRRLTTGNSVTRGPLWSPDGRRIAFSARLTGHQSDTSAIDMYIVDADNPGLPVKVGTYYGVQWLDAEHVLSIDGTRSYINAVANGTGRRFFTDSLSVWSILGRTRIAYFDRRVATRGWYSATIASLDLAALFSQTESVMMPDVKGIARKIAAPPGYLGQSTSDVTLSGDIYQNVGGNRLRMISVDKGSEKLLPATFPGLAEGRIDVSGDGKEIVFITPRLSSRLVLLQNVFH